MKIVVTGAAGFIGSVLSMRAMECGHNVLALDDLSRGLNKIEHVRGLTFMRHDCRSGIGEAVEQARNVALTRTPFDGVDAVVHLAAGTGSLDRPLDELRALNVEMTKRVYQDAVYLGAKVFAFPTTSLALAVPDSPYVISKEEAFVWVKAQRIVPVIPLRFFNVSGAYKGMSEFRKHEVHLIPRLVECFVKQEEFVVNGDDYHAATVDGSPSRDFVNVLDVVETILALIDKALEGFPPPQPHFDGATWIGTGRTTTAKQAHTIIEQYLGPVKMKIGPRRAFDTAQLSCPLLAVNNARAIRGCDLVPAWVSIRDEALTLLPADMRHRVR